MAKYFLLDLLAASLCLVLLTVCNGIRLERVQSFVFAICCGLSGRGHWGDTFHTGIESKGCQSAVAVHYDFLHFCAHSPACYIVSHTACQKNIPENTSICFFVMDNASFERYISKLREYQPNIKHLPYEISRYITKTLYGYCFFHAYSYCIDCATCFVGCVRVCGRIAVDT